MPEPIPKSGPDARYDPDKVTTASFDVVRRGFNEGQVRQFLRDLAGALTSAYRTEDALRVAIVDLDAKLVDASEIDEHALTERLGAEAAAILNTARDAAKSRLADAEETATTLETDSQREAEEILSSAREAAETLAADSYLRADEVLADAEEKADQTRVAADAVLVERTAEAEAVAAKRLVESADEMAASRVAADAIISQAKQEGRVLLVEAQRHREQLLTNLETRRLRLRHKVERLQAGRDRLLEAYEVVQESIDVARRDLETSFPDAKIAGDRAVRRVEDETPRSVEFLEDEIDQARRAGLLGDADAIAAEAKSMARPDELAALAPQPFDDDDDTAMGTEPEPTVAVDDVAEPESVAVVDGDGDVEVEPEPVAVDEDDDDPEPESDSVAVVDDDPEPESDSVAVVDDDDDHGDVEPEPEPAAVDGDDHDGDAETESDEAAPTGAAALLFARLRDDKSVETREASTQNSEPDESDPDVTDEADTDDGLLEQRAAVVDSLSKVVARNLKRALSDLQNEVLHCHRTDGERNQALGTAALTVAITEPLAQAWAAGAGTVGRTGDASDARLDNVILAIEPAVFTPLRTRLDDALDKSAAVESVRNVCRDVRAQFGDIAVDAVEAAFADGILDTLPADCPVKWMPGDRSGDASHASEATDAEVRLGESFPNGLVKPEPFSGCGCLVAPIHA